jgi:hypothetical protein
MARDADWLRLSRDCVSRGLALGLAASQLLDLGLLAAARIVAGLLGRLLLARCALCLFAFFLAQCFGICHSPCPVIYGLSASEINDSAEADVADAYITVEPWAWAKAQIPRRM